MTSGGRTHVGWVLAIVVGLAGISCTAQKMARRLEPQTPSAHATGLLAYGKLPLSFEPNQGQTDPQVKFLAHGLGYTLFLTAKEAVLALQNGTGDKGHGTSQKAAVVRMELVGANPHPSVSALEELPGKANYFLGNDPAKWRTNVPTYAKVQYEDIYPGISLILYGNQGQLEYDFLVFPGADPSLITLAFEGANALEIDPQGNLVLHTTGGEIHQHKPIVYQEIDGTKRPLSGRYVRKGRQQVGFQIARYDRTKPLVIDPTLIYSTYLGGGGEERSYRVSVDTAGYIYVTGFTTSTNFPTQNPYQATLSGYQDAFITKFNPSGSPLVYSTYLGGSSGEISGGIAVDSVSNVYVAGWTTSTNFPTMNPFQPTKGGGVFDAYVAKFDSTGSTLLYSTYLGGNDDEGASSITIDAMGNIYVAGATSSTNFPTHNPYQANLNPGGPLFGRDAFVAKIDPSQPGPSSLVYSTYLGGSNGDDQASGIAVDPAGKVYVTGHTWSASFPTRNAFQPTFGGDLFDAFVAKLDPSQSGSASLIYSTYLGGSSIDQGWDIAVDVAGNAYVVGNTGSPNFPLQNPYQATLGGSSDAFVTKFNASGTSLVFSTYLGGSGPIPGWVDVGSSIAVDTFGSIYVTGRTDSDNFPTQNPFQGSYSGGLGSDVFVTRFNPAGPSLVYSTYLGGNNVDEGYGIAVSPSGHVIVTGKTASANFPTQNPFQGSYAGGISDAFVSAFDPLPLGAIRYGASTPACLGPIAINVTDTPRAGNQNFAFTAANAPPNAQGVLVVGLGQSLSGIRIGGITVYIDFSQPIILTLPAASNTAGFSQVNVPIPSGTAGIRVFAQFAWANTATCGGVGTLSASDALAVTVQP